MPFSFPARIIKELERPGGTDWFDEAGMRWQLLPHQLGLSV